MKCPYCGITELGTGDINGICFECQNKLNQAHTWPKSISCDEYEIMKAERDRWKTEAMAARAALEFEKKTTIAEQDRIIGSLTREVSYLKDLQMHHNEWNRKAKKEAGYHDNISFDIVWKETLEKAKAYQEMGAGDDS
jgi:hypothetical protein